MERQRKFANFSFAASIDPSQEHAKEFLKSINKDNSQLTTEAKKLSLLASEIAMAYNLNGAGLFLDQYIRKFLFEYNGRVLRGKGAHLPSSINVMTAFIEPSVKTYILELLEEELFTVGFAAILDFLTRPGVDRNLSNLESKIEEFKIYEFNMFGAFTEFELPGSENFIFCGFSFVRDGDELSILGIFGEKNASPVRDQSFNISEARAFEGREDLIDSEEVDLSDFPLFEDWNYQPVILLMRVDISKKVIQARYALSEKQDAYLVFSDDPSLLSELRAQVGEQHPSVANSIEGLQKYSKLFGLLVQMPLFIDDTNEAEDKINIVRYPTDFRLRSAETQTRKLKQALGVKLCPAFVNVQNFVVSGEEEKKYTVPSSGLMIETTGYWRTLALDAVGSDKSGNPIQGKTWVHQTVSWIEAKSNADAVFKEPIDIKISARKNDEGYVYVMRNAQHPKDVYKVGFTLHDPYDRANALYSTSGQPDVFNVVQTWKVFEPRAIEQQVHQLLKNKRVNNNREFFKEKYDKIRACIEVTIESFSGKGV